MKRSLLTPGIIATIVVVAIYYFTPELGALTKFYGQHLRRSLFSGFLTVGGFLFSLKTFIIIKMKENVYSHERYKERVEEQKELNSNITYYGPLKRLSHLLFFSVLASFVTAILQFTVGLLECPIATLICVWSATFSISLLVSSLFVIKGNMDDWFTFLENESKRPN